MLKQYIVDVRNLTPEEQATVRDRLEGPSFMVCDMYSGDRGVVALKVYWDRPEDFLSSSSCPLNCHCFEI